MDAPVDNATILQFCRKVNSGLGEAHSESCYHKALEVELRKRGIDYESEVQVPINYRNHCVGTVRPDLIISHQLVVELKAVPQLLPNHRQQLAKYMRLLGLQRGIVVNFGSPVLTFEEVRFDV